MRHARKHPVRRRRSSSRPNALWLLVDRKVHGGGRFGCRTACAVYAAGGMAGIGYGNRHSGRCSDGRRWDRGRKLVPYILQSSTPYG